MDSPVARGKFLESDMSFFDPPSRVGWLVANGGVRVGPRLPWAWVDRKERPPYETVFAQKSFPFVALAMRQPLIIARYSKSIVSKVLG